MNALPDSIPARGAAASASRPLRIGQLVRQSFTAMTAQERARLVAMYGVIVGLHVAGFVILFAFVVPSHYKGLGVGVAVLAYTLGLRHAFDADHISAIDNCTRKVLGERQGTGAPRPLGCGTCPTSSWCHRPVPLLCGKGTGMRLPRPPELMRGRPGQRHQMIGDTGRQVAPGLDWTYGVVVTGDCWRGQTVQLAVMAISRPMSAVPGSYIRVRYLTVSRWWPR